MVWQTSVPIRLVRRGRGLCVCVSQFDHILQVSPGNQFRGHKGKGSEARYVHADLSLYGLVSDELCSLHIFCCGMWA